MTEMVAFFSVVYVSIAQDTYSPFSRDRRGRQDVITWSVCRGVFSDISEPDTVPILANRSYYARTKMPKNICFVSSHMV